LAKSSGKGPDRPLSCRDKTVSEVIFPIVDEGIFPTRFAPGIRRLTTEKLSAAHTTPGHVHGFCDGSQLYLELGGFFTWVMKDISAFLSCSSWSLEALKKRSVITSKKTLADDIILMT
ncbi:hypothetical protein Tco_1190686, partial [Tanacetum coccineum]